MTANENLAHHIDYAVDIRHLERIVYSGLLLGGQCELTQPQRSKVQDKFNQQAATSGN